MAAVAYEITAADFIPAEAYFDGLIDRVQLDRLELGIAALVESQTRRRISEEKTAPDGTPWADWSPAYAATRHDGHSLMQNDGDFLDDIFHARLGGQTFVGSSMVYAAIHQFGGKAGRNRNVDIVARPSFGLSNDNEIEIAELVEDYMRSVLQ